MTVDEALKYRDRARIAALNFAGQEISSSDGTYDLLVDVIADAIRDCAEPLFTRIAELEADLAIQKEARLLALKLRNLYFGGEQK